MPFFTLIRYDRRGCYRSAFSASGFELSNQVEDLAQLLDHCGVDRTHVLGSSAGGPIATLFAATHADRVSSLMLVGTGLDLFPNDDEGTVIARSAIVALQREGPVSAFRNRPDGVETSFEYVWAKAEAADQGALDSFLEDQRAKAKNAAEYSEEERVKYYAAELMSIAAYMDIDLRSYAGRITCPTVVLHGRNDLTVPLPWAEELTNAIPSATLRVLDDEAHGLIYRSKSGRRRALDLLRDLAR